MAASRFDNLKGATLAAAFACATLLAGCGQHHVAPAQAPAPPMSRPDTLAGAPADLPPPPTDVAPPMTPPPPRERPGDRPGDRDVVYDLGPVVQARDTMAPIPNPPEGAPRRTHSGRPRHATRPARPARALRPHAGRGRMAHPASGPMRPSSAGRNGAAPAVVVPHRAHPAPGKPATPAPARPAAGARDAGKSAAKVTPATGDRATKLGALQATLKDSLARTALLNVPDLKPDQPADVTLTLPADFASVVRDEAEKQGLQDAAASVNMTALLAGDGYAVAPDETQSQPLTVGQPTEFHWTVTAQPNAKGPLHADVGADLLGGGDEALQLGSVMAAGKGGLHISPRAWGAALLVLLAVIVFAVLGRGRGAASRRRMRNSAPRAYERSPLDMGAGPPPPGIDRDV